MSAFDTHPQASHRTFPYYFDDDFGFCFGPCALPPSPPFKYDNDLAIYYGNMGTSDFLDVKCSRWDVQDYSVIIETWMKKSDVDTLMDNIIPGAVGELFKILGRRHMYDTTWSAENTIKFLPTPSSNDMGASTLRNMRKETIAFVKNVVLHPIPNSAEGWIGCKIEAMVSGSGDL